MKIYNKFHFKNKKEPDNCIYIGRPSKWGNPFSHLDSTKAQFKVENREQAILEYKKWILSQPDLLKDLIELEGKDLICWCSPKSCHGDILKELIESGEYKNVD